MKTVGTHGLACLEPEDMAAVALSLQANAQATDAALKGIGTSLDARLGAWWWSASNSTAINASNNSGWVLPENMVGAELSGDGNIGPTVQANGFPATASFSSTFDWPDGIYMCGSTIKWTVATPNNNTPRTLMVTAVNRLNGQATLTFPNGELYMSTEYERSAAGNDGSITVSGLFQVGPTMSRFAACFSHGNTSSVLVIPAGGWRMWFMYLGSGLVV